MKLIKFMIIVILLGVGVKLLIPGTYEEAVDVVKVEPNYVENDFSYTTVITVEDAKGRTAAFTILSIDWEDDCSVVGIVRKSLWGEEIIDIRVVR